MAKKVKKVYLKFPKWSRMKKVRGALRIQEMFERAPFYCHFCSEEERDAWAVLAGLYKHIRKKHGPRK